MTGMTRAQWTRTIAQLHALGHTDHAVTVRNHLTRHGKGKLPVLHLCTNPNLDRCRKA